jgi:hypothetical protein
MFGYSMTASYFEPDRKPLFTVSKAYIEKLTASGSAKVEFFEQKIGLEPTLFTHPGGNHNGKKLYLYNISWTSKDGAVSIPVSADLSEGRALSLFLAVDSSDVRNPKDTPQSLSITLRDRSGTEGSVVIPQGTSALSYYTGYMEHVEMPDMDVWFGTMPLGELRIPLSYFGNIEELSEIVISTDQTDSGAIMLSGAYLVK